MILLINSLKSLRSNKLKIILITFLIFLSGIIYTSFNTTITNIEKSYYSYLKKQNVFDISFELIIDYEKDFKSEEVKRYFSNKKIESGEKLIIDTFLDCKKNDTCNNYIIYEIDNIFSKYGLKSKKEQEKLNYLKETYNLEIELFETKLIKDGNHIIKVIPYKDYKINIPYLIKGEVPSNNNEITILPNFSKENNLNIYHNYTLNNKNYLIKGYLFASNYIYPTFSNSNPIFDYKRNNIAFVTEDEFNNINGIKVSVYVAKFNEKILSNIFNIEKNNITKTDNTIMLDTSVNTLIEDLVILKAFSSVFQYLILIITLILLLIIIKKKIDVDKKYIGILKSFGYKKITIAISYLVYPFITSVVGGILGFLIGNILSKVISNIYLKSFNIVVLENNIYLENLIYSIFIPLLFLTSITLFFIIFLLGKKDIDLIRDVNNTKINFLTKFVNNLTSKRSFLTKLKYSLLTKSYKKLFIVITTSLIVGFLITIIFTWFNLFNNLINENFSKYKFSYMITYNTLFTKEEDIKTDNILMVNAKINKVLDSKKNNKNIKDEVSITLNGVEENLKYIEIKNKNDKNLLKYLADKTIIISDDLKRNLDINIGDYIVFNINEKEISFEVVGINKNVLDKNCYVKNKNLSNILGFNYNIYNVSYSIDEKYSDLSFNNTLISEIYSIDTLKENIINSLSFYNNFTYLIIIFSLILVFVIISILTNILVDENIKVISLMKLFGYKNKEISKVILNVYTSVIVIFYLLGIPFAKYALTKIMNYLSGYLNLSLSVNLSIFKVILGLILFLSFYYFAVFLSKRKINKISADELLKE